MLKEPIMNDCDSLDDYCDDDYFYYECEQNVKYEGKVENDAETRLKIKCAYAGLSSTAESDAVDITSMVPRFLEARQSHDIVIFNKQDFCKENLDLEGMITIEINGGSADECGGTVSLLPPPAEDDDHDDFD